MPSSSKIFINNVSIHGYESDINMASYTRRPSLAALHWRCIFAVVFRSIASLDGSFLATSLRFASTLYAVRMLYHPPDVFRSNAESAALKFAILCFFLSGTAAFRQSTKWVWKAPWLAIRNPRFLDWMIQLRTDGAYLSTRTDGAYLGERYRYITIFYINYVLFRHKTVWKPFIYLLRWKKTTSCYTF